MRDVDIFNTSAKPSTFLAYHKCFNRIHTLLLYPGTIISISTSYTSPLRDWGGSPCNHNPPHHGCFPPQHTYLQTFSSPPQTTRGHNTFAAAPPGGSASLLLDIFAPKPFAKSLVQCFVKDPGWLWMLSAVCNSIKTHLKKSIIKSG